MSSDSDPLIQICKILNEKQIKYVLIGARACALHGYIRATEDIDILLQKDSQNLEKTIIFLQEFYSNLELKLLPSDFYENIVIKILDEPELDLTISAWSLSFEDALSDINHTVINGIPIPFLGLKTLIESKNTDREQDLWDKKVLTELLRNKKIRPL